jgi:microtubule-associated protein-like 1/2
MHDVGYDITIATLNHYKCPITQLDWSTDSAYLQTNSRDLELAFFAIDKKDLSKSSYITTPATVRDVKWSTNTCALSWPTRGVSDPNRDGFDIRATDASHDRSLLVAADDYGYVTLFRYFATRHTT